MPANVIQLHEKHMSLWKKSLSEGSSEALVEEALKLLEELRSAGLDIADPQQRQRIGSYALYWGSLIFERTGQYPETRLEPARPSLESVARLEVQPVDLFGPPVPPPAPALFVDRQELLSQLVEAILSHKTTVLALSGIAGVGKTALALALANHPSVAAAFPDGRIWLPLGPKPDVTAQLDQILSQLGHSSHGLTTLAERADRLRTVLAGKTFLLVLDDVWSLSDARPFLEACRLPAHAIITTRSRQLQHDLGAWDVQVDVLDPDSALHLLEAAGPDAKAAVEADRGEAAALVAKLGCLPLALHVAGRRLNQLARAYNPERAVVQIQEDLRRDANSVLRLQAGSSRLGIVDSEPSLEAVLALSYLRLPGDDIRRAFRYLAVFGAHPISFTASAMAAVWQEEGETRISERLIALVDSGLLERRPDFSGVARYALHQIVWSFARAVLDQNPEEARAAAIAHARYFAGVVESYDTAFLSGAMSFNAPPEWENVCQALDWLVTRGVDDQEAAHILVAYARAWRNVLVNGPASRRIEWLNAALMAARAVEDLSVQSLILRTKGDILFLLRRIDEALLQYDQALRLCEAVGDHLGMANVLQSLGDVLAFQDRRIEALARYEQALGLFRAVGARLGEASVLKAQGDVLYLQKQMAEVLARYEQALGLFRAVGDRLGEANALKAQGDVLAFQKRNAEALARYEQALGLFRAVGTRLGEANVLKALGDVLVFQDRRDEALACYEQALGLFRAVGDRLGEANVLQAQGDLLYFQKQTTEALARYEAALFLYRAIGTRLGEANVLKAQGDILAFLDQRDEALARYEAALGQFRAVGDRLGEANVLKSQADMLAFLARWDEALTRYEVALGLFRAVGARLGEANVLQAQGEVLASQGRWDEALTRHEQALALYQAVGDRLGEANVLKAQGDALAFLKREGDAFGYYEAALTLFQAVGDRLGEAYVLKEMGDLLAFREQREDALVRYEAAQGLFQAVGDRLGEANVLKAQGQLALEVGKSEEGIKLLEAAHELYVTVGDRVGLANCGIILGRHAASQGDIAAAIRHMQPAVDFAMEINHPLGQQLTAEIDGWVKQSTVSQHLHTRAKELETMYDALSRRIAAIDVDISRTSDSEHRFVLDQRRAELAAERDKIAEQLARGPIEGPSSNPGQPLVSGLSLAEKADVVHPRSADD